MQSSILLCAGPRGEQGKINLPYSISREQKNSGHACCGVFDF